MAGLDASLEFVFQVRVDFAGRLKFSPERNGVRRGYTGVAGGVIEGPRLSGKVLPDSGGDWPHFMPDGVVYFEAIYVIEASDGTQIVINMHLMNVGSAPDHPQVKVNLLRASNFHSTAATSWYGRGRSGVPWTCARPA